MKKLLLYIGTFDPIHIGHIHFCTEALKLTESEICVIMPSGDNNYKSPTIATSAVDRFKQCKKAVEKIENIIVSDYEVSKKDYIYTLDTLEYIRNKFPANEVCLLMGSDTFLSLKYWKGSREIIANTKIFTCIRKGDDVKQVNIMRDEIFELGGYAEILPIDTINISSQQIRESPMIYKKFIAD